jgi:hypothetical protein
MKTKICAAMLCVTIISPVYAIDQWPGQSDFGNVNGPVTNNGGPYAQLPIVDFRFGSSGNPGQGAPWRMAPSQADKTKLTPSQFSACRQDQHDLPTRDISCEGPNVR